MLLLCLVFLQNISAQEETKKKNSKIGFKLQYFLHESFLRSLPSEITQDAKESFNFGLQTLVDFKLGEKSSFSTGLGVSVFQLASNGLLYTNANNETVFNKVEGFDFRNAILKLTYCRIPVVFNYNLLQKSASGFKIHGGFYADYLAQSRQELIVKNNQVFQALVIEQLVDNNVANLNTFQFGALAGIEYEKKINEAYSASFIFDFCYGLNSIIKDNRGDAVFPMTLDLGISFNF